MIKYQPPVEWFAIQTKVHLLSSRAFRNKSRVESQPRSELLLEVACAHMLLHQVEVVVGFLLQSLAILSGGHSLLTGF